MSKFCQNCGSELKVGANVCINCGKFVEENNKPTEKNNASNTFVTMLLLSGIFFMLSLFSLLNSYGLGDVWEPSWSDYYWFYTNNGWASASILIGSVTLILSIITLVIGIKKSKQENSVNYFIFSLFVLLSTIFLLINAYLSFNNSY